MHSSVTLTAAIGNAPHIPFGGLTDRAIHLQHFPTLVAAQPLYTAAGGATGSRYVAPGGPQTLYVALEADTAFRELNQFFLGLAASPLGATQVVSGLLRPAPYVTLGIHVELTRVLDLTDLGVRRHLGLTDKTPGILPFPSDSR